MKETEVSRGHSSRRMGKPNYRAKGRTGKELSRKAEENVSSRDLDGMEARADAERRLKAGRKRTRCKSLSDAWRKK